MSKWINLKAAINVFGRDSEYHADTIADMLLDLPTIEVGGLIDRRCFAGKWKDHYYPHFEVAGIECSICGKDVPYWDNHYKEPRFCPNCGARMEIEE